MGYKGVWSSSGAGLIPHTMSAYPPANTTATQEITVEPLAVHEGDGPGRPRGAAWGGGESPRKRTLHSLVRRARDPAASWGASRCVEGRCGLARFCRFFGRLAPPPVDALSRPPGTPPLLRAGRVVPRCTPEALAPERPCISRRPGFSGSSPDRAAGQMTDVLSDPSNAGPFGCMRLLWIEHPRAVGPLVQLGCACLALLGLVRLATQRTIIGGPGMLSCAT